MPTKLGQHFLKNDLAIKKIIAALDIQPGETIIEIGPGRGALTFPLLEECAQKKCKLIAIEKDTQLAKSLGENIQPSTELCSGAGLVPHRNKVSGAGFSNHNFQIIEGDALKILPELVSKLKIVNYKLVGNIPYYITGKLLRTISELKNKPSVSVLMVQKEVAERIYAQPHRRQGSGGQARMNLLAAATQYWADSEIILRLKAKEFDPPPEVDSAVIRLATRVLATSDLEEKNYYKLIHIIFKQPRKTLANNLRAGLNISKEEIEKILNLLNLSPNSRPQDLTIENIIQLTDKLPISNS